jgi:serine/threonine-protein kinase
MNPKLSKMNTSDLLVSPNSKEKSLLIRAGKLLTQLVVITILCGWIALKITNQIQPLVVPQIVGLTPMEAIRKLHAKGLKFSLLRSQYDEYVPKGLISVQIPVANSYLKIGQPVSAILSRGNPKEIIPSVIGLSYPQAEITLAQDHLRTGNESYIPSAYIPAEVVLSQYPPSNIVVPSNTKIDLLLSSGTPKLHYVMPNLINQSLNKAFRLLRPLGIIIKNIKVQINDTLLPETILQEKPLPGSEISPHNTVALVISDTSSDKNEKARYRTIKFTVPGPTVHRVQIDILDNTGTRTIYDKMKKPGSEIKLGVTIHGRAEAEIYLNQQFFEEISIPN